MVYGLWGNLSVFPYFGDGLFEVRGSGQVVNRELLRQSGILILFFFLFTIGIYYEIRDIRFRRFRRRLRRRGR